MGEHFRYKEYIRTHLIDDHTYYVVAVAVKDKEARPYTRRDAVALYIVDIHTDAIIRIDVEDINNIYRGTVYIPSSYLSTDIYDYAMLKGLPIVVEKEPFNLEHKAGFHYTYYQDTLNNIIKYYKYDGTPMDKDEYHKYALQEDGFVIDVERSCSRDNGCMPWTMGNMKNIVSCLRESAVGETSVESRNINYIGKIDSTYLQLEDFLYEIYCGIYGDLKDNVYNIANILFISKEFIEGKLIHNGKLLAKLATATIKKQRVMIVGDILTENIEVLPIEEATELKRQGKIVYAYGFSNSEVNTKGKPKGSWCGVPIKGDKYMTTDGIVTREQFIKDQVDRVGYFFDMMSFIRGAVSSFDAKVDKGTVIGVSKMPKVCDYTIRTEVSVDCLQDKYIQDSDIDGLKRISYTPLYIGESIYKETNNVSDIIENMRGNEIGRNGKILTRLKCSGAIVIRDIEKIAVDAIEITGKDATIDFQCDVKEVSRQAYMNYVVKCHSTTTLNAFMSDGAPSSIEYDGNMDTHTFIRLGLMFLSVSIPKASYTRYINRSFNKKRYRMEYIPEFEFNLKEGKQFSYEDTYRYMASLMNENSDCRRFSNALITFWEDVGTLLDVQAVQDAVTDYTWYSGN